MTICSGCDLAAGCKTPHMSPDISGMRSTPEPGPDVVCDVMIIGEAPGHDEDVVGTPFVGASGSLLRTIVEDVGLDEFGIVYTNAVRCRPPNNNAPTAKQIKACAPNVIAEIEHYGPRLVILLGNAPLKAVLGETGITAWRGSKLERDGVMYMPTFHPAYILRNNTELPTLLADMQAAYDVAAGNGGKTTVEDYDIKLVVGEVDAWDMYDAITKAGTVAWDTESRNARPYASDARMIMMSFAIDKPVKRAWAVLPDNRKVIEYCKRILGDARLKIICHNAKYDQHVIWNAWGIKVPGIVGDSMIASWVLDPTPGRHGLKHLAGRLLGMYEYNRELDEYHQQNPDSDPSGSGDQSLVPMTILAPYAAMDAIATLEVHKRLYKQMNPAQKTLYNELLIPVGYVLQQMEQDGVALDQYIIKRYTKIYGAIQAHQYDAMMGHPTVNTFVRNRQAAIDKDWAAKHPAGTKTRATKPTFVFNPNSDLQMRELLFGKRYFKFEALGKTAKGASSIKWDYLKPFAATSPFLQAYHYYTLLDKMLSTYIGPAATRWPDADGRVRSTYNVGGTVSGRLSSSDPNLQNIPTPEKEPDTVLADQPVKNIFTASDWGEASPELVEMFADALGPYVCKGGGLLSADYSGMELRTMASVSHCKTMLEIFERGEDVHRIVSSGIFNVPVEQVTKEMRYAGKWTNWTLLYGGSAHTLHRMYDIPLDDGVRFVKAYYSMFPEILEYQKETIQFAHDNGYVESMFGQRRYLPYINDRDKSRQADAEREAVNHPIQSVASQMLFMVLIIMGDMMRDLSLRTKMVNTVHDSIMFDAPLDEIDTVARLVKHVMEDLRSIYKAWFPGIDLSWFICPLKADIEIGSHYGSLTEYHIEEDNHGIH